MRIGAGWFRLLSGSAVSSRPHARSEATREALEPVRVHPVTERCASNAGVRLSVRRDGRGGFVYIVVCDGVEVASFPPSGRDRAVRLVAAFEVEAITTASA